MVGWRDNGHETPDDKPAMGCCGRRLRAGKSRPDTDLELAQDLFGGPLLPSRSDPRRGVPAWLLPATHRHGPQRTRRRVTSLTRRRPCEVATVPGVHSKAQRAPGRCGCPDPPGRSSAPGRRCRGSGASRRSAAACRPAGARCGEGRGAWGGLVARPEAAEPLAADRQLADGSLRRGSSVSGPTSARRPAALSVISSHSACTLLHARVEEGGADQVVADGVVGRQRRRERVGREHVHVAALTYAGVRSRVDQLAIPSGAFCAAAVAAAAGGRPRGRADAGSRRRRAAARVRARRAPAGRGCGRVPARAGCSSRC